MYFPVGALGSSERRKCRGHISLCISVTDEVSTLPSSSSKNSTHVSFPTASLGTLAYRHIGLGEGREEGKHLREQLEVVGVQLKVMKKLRPSLFKKNC